MSGSGSGDWRTTGFDAECENILDSFERAWQRGDVVSLDHFLQQSALGPSMEYKRHALLIELIKIDLEYRWSIAAAAALDKHGAQLAGSSKIAISSQSIPPPPLIEEYLRQFPELGRPSGPPVGLICEEYRVRVRFGDRPTHAEYVRRFGFPEAKLVELLEQVDHLLRAEHIGFSTTCARPDSVVNESAGNQQDPTAFAERQLTKRFRLLRRIGAGGMGVVYEALDLERNSRVALKTLPEVHGDALYRFKKEFRSLAELEHPHLVSLFELHGSDEGWFFSMQLIDGVDFVSFVRGRHLDDAGTASFADGSTEPTPAPVAVDREAGGPQFHSAGTARRHRVDLERLRIALTGLVEGIQALHRFGKLHRDIKPSNVLVQPDGAVVLLDFGLVGETNIGAAACEGALMKGNWLPGADDSRAVSGQGIVGTVAYMAPEQALGAPLTPASDWYAVGVMLYEALTGRRPFGGDRAEILVGKWTCDPIPPSQLAPGVPDDLEAICMDLLARSPSKRPCGDDVAIRLRANTRGVRSSIPAQTLTESFTPFFGRERHLEALRSAFQRVGSDGTMVVRVQGTSGVGKTTLVGHFLEEVRGGADVLILTGRCYEQESVPYKALDSLIDSLCHYLLIVPQDELRTLLPEDSDAISQLFPVFERVTRHARLSLERNRVDLPRETRRRAFQALRELLARIATRKSLVIAIDDLQWGDVDSALLLASVLAPPNSPPFLFLLCYRSEYVGTSECLTELFEGQREVLAGVPSIEVEVAELPADEATRLAGILLAVQGMDSSRLTPRVAHESGGNPFFMSEIVRELASTGEPIDAMPLDRQVDLSQILWGRVSRQTEEARRLLEVVAVAGKPLRLRIAQAAAELLALEPRTLAALRTARLLRGSGYTLDDEVETFHDRVRESVLFHLASDVKKGHHARLAESLEVSEGADAETIAVHFQQADLPQKAGSYYRLAADHASVALAFDRATHLYRRSLELKPPVGHEHYQVRRKLGEALANAGRGSEAASEFQLAAHGADRTEQLELQRLAAYQYCISGRTEEGRAVLRNVLQSVGMRLPKSGKPALFSLLISRVRLRLRGIGFRERPIEQIAKSELTRIDTTWSASAGLSMIDLIVAADFQTRNLLLALRAGEPYRITRALAWEAAHSANEGKPARRRTGRLLRRARQLADAIGNPHGQAMVSFAEGAAGFTSGQWRRGRQSLEQAEKMFRNHCPGAVWEVGTTLTFLLWCLYYLGDLNEMLRRSSTLLKDADGRGDLYAATNLATFTVPIGRLAANDPLGAAEVIEQYIKRWPQQEFQIPHMLALMGSTYVDLYRGDSYSAWRRLLDRWPSLKASQLLRAQVIRVVLNELRARAAVGVLGATDSPNQVLRDVRRCVRRLRSERVPYALGMSDLIQAGVAYTQRELPDAERWLIQAVREFESADMGLFAAVARRRLGQTAMGEPGAAWIAASDSWMTANGVKDTESMTRAITPWTN